MPSTESNVRANEDPAPPAPRTKRTKYAAVACDICKKRKIKCQVDPDANSCRKCLEQDAECIFSASDSSSSIPSRTAATTTDSVGIENVESRLALLEGRFHALHAEFSQHLANAHMQTGTPSSVPTTSQGMMEAERPTSRHHQPQFLGPTRPAYAFNIARASLQGHSTAVDDPAFSSPPSPTSSTREPVPRSTHPSTDPLRVLPKREVLRLLTIYAEEINPVYPIFDIDALISQTQLNFDAWLISADTETNTGVLDISLVRIGVAIGNLIDCSDENSFSRQLISLVEIEAAQTYTASAMSCREAVIFTTLSIYYFHADQELLAWRRIGTAARAVLELGLHRKNSMLKNLPDDGERMWAVRLFWCIYILDRRWSIGLSLPFTLQDADIDSELIQPDKDAEYLKCMIDYGRICSNLWQSYPSLGSSAKALSRETISYLEFLIEGWGKSIPKNLRLESVQSISNASSTDKTIQRLRVLLHLRKNHLRMLINRHFVLSHACVQDNLEAAQSLVATAEDTIAVLVRLEDIVGMYARQQAVYNHFLMTALTIIFLAVCHAPNDFGVPCRPAFDNAIKLVRTSALKGSNSRRLWKTIQSLLPHAQAIYADLPPANAEPRPQTEVVRGAPNFMAIGPSQPSNGLQPSSRLATEFQSYPIQPVGNFQNSSSMNVPQGAGHPYEGVGASLPWSPSVPPIHDINEMTDSLTDFYNSLETSNFESYLANFNQGMADNFLDDADTNRLFQDPFRAV